MKVTSEHIPGYSYGAAEVAKSPVSMVDLENLKISAGFTDEDELYLRLAGAVLTGQTKQIVDHWRSGIIASIPNLARHSRSPEKFLESPRFQRMRSVWLARTVMRGPSAAVTWLSFESLPPFPRNQRYEAQCSQRISPASIGGPNWQSLGIGRVEIAQGLIPRQ